MRLQTQQRRQRDGTAVVSSAHVNAVGVALSLRELGWTGRIACLRINATGRALAQRWPALCECWTLQLERLAEFPEQLFERVAPESVAAVFFCDERFLPLFAQQQVAERFPNACYHLGTRSQLDIVLDRLKFYEYVEANGLGDTPRTVEATQDPWEAFGGPFRTRVWKSWRGVKKLLRGRTIQNQRDLESWEHDCAAEGMFREEWGYQELLSTDPRDLLCVCGWHGQGTALYLTTRWIRQSGENGWLIEAIRAPRGLEDTAYAILAALNYSGPFAMEFVRDLRTQSYKVIELNPRFWMQHRLVGNDLVRRYLGFPSSICNRRRPARYWLNTDTALRLLLTLRGFGIMPLALSAEWGVPIRGSLGYAMRGTIRGLYRRLGVRGRA